MCCTCLQDVMLVLSTANTKINSFNLGHKTLFLQVTFFFDIAKCTRSYGGAFFDFFTVSFERFNHCQLLNGAIVCWIDTSVSRVIGHLLAGLLSLSGTAIFATPEFSIVSIIFFDTPMPNTFKETMATFINQEWQ